MRRSERRSASRIVPPNTCSAARSRHADAQLVQVLGIFAHERPRHVGDELLERLVQHGAARRGHVGRRPDGDQPRLARRR